MQMQIGGLQKLSLIDFPGKVSAVVFTQGCNFRCPYCHNRELVIPEDFKEPLCEREVLNFLFDRRDKLQGVVITGGEPTLQKGLIPFLKKVKRFGYAVKIDTNASQPNVLKQIISAHLVDFIAVDIKAPLERYHKLAGVTVKVDDIVDSINIILESGVEHLFRTTVVKPLMQEDDLKKITDLISSAQRYILQEFVPRETVLDNSLLDRGGILHIKNWILCVPTGRMNP